MGQEEDGFMKIGEKVFVTEEVNWYWTGYGTVTEVYPSGNVCVTMDTGRAAGNGGSFAASDLVQVVAPPLEVVGGQPHGFGIWAEGKYHSVDVGALGKIITDLQAWKESAIKSTPDWQAVGEALGLPIGTDVSQVLLEKIQELKADANETRWGVLCACQWKSHKVISVCGAHAEVTRRETDKLAERYQKLLDAR